MTDALIVESDEAYALAHEIAGRLGTSVGETVVKALRELGDRMPPAGSLTPAQEADLAAIRALVAEAQKHRIEGATTDHDHLYDAYGLPV